MQQHLLQDHLLRFALQEIAIEGSLEERRVVADEIFVNDVFNGIVGIRSVLRCSSFPWSIARDFGVACRFCFRGCYVDCDDRLRLASILY